MDRMVNVEIGNSKFKVHTTCSDGELTSYLICSDLVKYFDFD